MANQIENAASIHVLRGAHVLDTAQGIDRVTDVLMQDGKILDIGDGLAPADAQITDFSGHILTPGWIDNHVHTYGTLGFSDPDSIGIWQGVTSFVDAGGPGIATMDEFMALMDGYVDTHLYAGPYIRPLGIIGAQFTEGDIRSLNGFPIPQWLDFMERHPGVIRFLKIAALSSYGSGPIKMGKGLAEVIGVPLYGHIGEFQMLPENPCAYELFKVSQAGDMIAHPYHNSGARIIDKNKKLMPEVVDARDRGVLFDIAFGSYNYSWDVAEAAYSQGLPPDIISSDLQQFNAIGPVYSLSHIMSILMCLGMSFKEVVKAVTETPAKAIGIDKIAGSLKPGMPAEITISKLETGKYEFFDTEGKSRIGTQRVVPVCAYLKGKRYDSDLTRCQNEDNWFLQIAEDHIPDAVNQLSEQQMVFLGLLAKALEPVNWEYNLNDLDLAKAQELRNVFDKTRAQTTLTLRQALLATFACFLDRPFTMQIGLFLMHFERAFLFSRLNQVLSSSKVVA